MKKLTPTQVWVRLMYDRGFSYTEIAQRGGRSYGWAEYQFRASGGTPRSPAEGQRNASRKGRYSGTDLNRGYDADGCPLPLTEVLR